MATLTQIDARHSNLTRELKGEAASSLGRVGRTLEKWIAEANAIARALPAADERRRAQLLGDYSAARKEAEKYFWFLCIQREALGLRNHDSLYDTYALPRAL